MNANTPNIEEDRKSDSTGQIHWVSLLVAVMVMIALPAAILFGSSGRLDWGVAWVYLVLITAFGLGGRIVVLRKSPDLAAERGNLLRKGDVKPWDRIIMPMSLVCPMVMLIVAGLDKRFAWSPELPILVAIAAFGLTTLGYSISTWAMLVNPFFSAVVRIQGERGHSVVTSGPYRYMRHPGYAGGAMTSLTIPLLLGSLWALIPAALAVCIYVIRTTLEDQTLQEELEGYRGYALRVRYRLLPGVW